MDKHDEDQQRAAEGEDLNRNFDIQHWRVKGRNLHRPRKTRKSQPNLSVGFVLPQ